MDYKPHAPLIYEPTKNKKTVQTLTKQRCHMNE